MLAEEKYLIKICSAYLNKTTFILDENIDYSKLYSISKHHNLVAVVFCVLKNCNNKNIIPENIYISFEDGFYEAIIRYDYQRKVINEISDILSQNKIKHVFFKGSEIKEYFPVPQARAMGDIDVLIPPDEKNNVKQILCSNGFTCKNSNGPVYDYEKKGILAEVHTKIISGKVGSSNAENGFSDAIENAEFNGYKGFLKPEYHFAYLITHIAHHFWFYGAGVKLIIDLAVMLKHFDINLDSVLIKMKEIGLEKFSKHILSICHKWFGCGKSYIENIREDEKFLLSYGAFGNANRNKAAVIERKELEEGKNTSAVFTRLRLLFPSYSKLKNIPYIKFIEGRPYLLPMAWIYRIVYNLKYRKDFVIDSTASIGSAETNKAAHKELKYFEEIGLL